VPREAGATDAVLDIFVDRLSVEAIRAKYKAGAYGKVNPNWIAGWLKLR
jgi:hypothetical protein